MNGIVVLVNNLDFFKIFLENYQDKGIKLFIINETRIGNKISQINNLLNQFNILNYEIIDSLDINKEIKKIINNDFVDNYTMSMNILGIWYIFKKYDINKLLFIDDDIILKNNFSKVFDSKENLFMLQPFGVRKDFNSFSNNYKKYFFEMLRIFNFNYSDEFWLNKYRANKINSGQFLICRNKIEIKRYEYFLKRFFESEIIYNSWMKRRSHTSLFIDEVFLTLFFINIPYNKLTKDCSLVFNSFEKINEGKYNEINKKSIIHICNNSHKYLTYNELINRKIIKGEKIYENKSNKV